jgi:hypothetical protein
MKTEYQKLLANERSKRWRKKHPELARKYAREEKRRLRKIKPQHFRDYDKQYRRNNPEKFKQYYLKRRDKMKIWARKRLLAKYGLTHETFNQKLILQEGKCAICKLKFEKRIEIDHCHSNGKTRDLLCEQCNLFLGYVEKHILTDKNILIEFAKYLKTHDCWEKH